MKYWTGYKRVKSNKKLEAWWREANCRGVGEILTTSMDKDGTGMKLELVVVQFLRSVCKAAAIASEERDCHHGLLMRLQLKHPQ